MRLDWAAAMKSRHHLRRMVVNRERGVRRIVDPKSKVGFRLFIAIVT
jgi:hypothetical protein